MPVKGKIRVLVVDDSLLFRETVARLLAADPGLEVVGTASDPFMARDKIIEFEPDVMTLDVEMPRMGGIEFLKRLIPQYPIPVVMVSSADSRVFEALKAGAVEFVKKPEVGRADRLDAMIRELKIKIKIASTAKLGNQKQTIRRTSVRAPVKTGSGCCDLIAIGASTGGTEAVDRLLQAMPANLPPVVIVQHMPSVFTRLYAERLNQTTRLHVREAENYMSLYRGEAVVAAGDHHLTVIRRQGQLQVKSVPGEKVSGHCPSVDVMFRSITELPDIKAVGVILTGMGRDGADGLLEMRQRGMPTIGQDETSCVVYGMPKVAYDLGAVQQQAPLSDIPDLILKLLAGEK